MTAPLPDRPFIEAMAKHLPPAGATLHLLDVDGRAGGVLAELRADLDITRVSDPDWPLPSDSVDAVVVYDRPLDGVLLDSALAALRPGGRLIALDPAGQPDAALVRLLEEAGYTRILVEPGAAAQTPAGVLMRGEKPHVQPRTTDRIREVAARDRAPEPRRAGRYVHVLVAQTPNKPVWALAPDDTITWNAVAVAGDDETVLLAFSSLPKAVEFMQPAVMAGRIKDVNKVAKFSWETARAWPFPLMLNPTDDIFDTHPVVFLPLDPRTAEAPDE